jgi:hypothetical protein
MQIGRWYDPDMIASVLRKKPSVSADELSMATAAVVLLVISIQPMPGGQVRHDTGRCSYLSCIGSDDEDY